MNTVEFNTIIKKMNKNNTGIHGYFEYGNGTNNTKHLKSDWYKNKIDYTPRASLYFCEGKSSCP